MKGIKLNLFIDSTQRVFFALLMDEHGNQLLKSQIDTKYKVEEIINFFNNIENVNLIKNFYINLGPGSFTGSRIALLYIRTISQITNANIFITNTFELLRFQAKNFFWKKKKFFIFATKNKSYCLTKKNITIKNKSKREKEINYSKLLFNFNNLKKIFIKADVKKLTPLYASNPHIGGFE